MQLLQALRHRSGPAITDNSTIRFQYRGQLTHRAGREHFVRCIQLRQREIPFRCRYSLCCGDVENHLPSQSWQACIGMRRQDLAGLDEKQVRIVGLRNEAVEVEHYRGIDPGNVRLD